MDRACAPSTAGRAEGRAVRHQIRGRLGDAGCVAPPRNSANYSSSSRLASAADPPPTLATDFGSGTLASLLLRLRHAGGGLTEEHLAGLVVEGRGAPELLADGPALLYGRLPGDPLEHLVPAADVARQEPARLLGEVLENRGALEDRQRIAAARRIVVDDRRHAVVRREPQEARRELLAPADVHRLHGVREAALLEHNADLPAVRRGPVVEVDHGSAPIPGTHLWQGCQLI